MQDDGVAQIDMAAESLFLIASDPASVREGLRRALTEVPLSRLTGEDRGTAEIVLAEVLNNIVEHAYASSTGDIRLILSLGPGNLVCRIEDEGRPMPGGTLPAGTLPDPSDLPEGGFGWHLIRVLSQGLTYDRVGGVNRLSFMLPAELSA